MLLTLAMTLSCVYTTSVVSAQDTDKTTKSTKKKKSKEDSSAAPATPAATTATPSKAPENSAGVTAADISKAQSSGMVWVNTDSGVYHKSGRYYGKTKQGKFMSEGDAKKAGYREAKQEIGTKKS
jgi:hypothetical protein